MTTIICNNCGKALSPKNKKRNIFSRDAIIIVGILVLVVIIVLWVRKPTSVEDTHAHNNEGHNHSFENGEGIFEEISRLEKVVASDPKDCESKLQLAHLYQDVGKIRESIGAYSSYLEEHPDNGEARIDLGVSYYRLAFEDTLNRKEYFDKALTEMKTGLKYSPDNQVGLFNIGIVNFQIGNSQEAIKYFNRCIEVDPNSSIAVKAKEILENHIY